MTLQLAPQELHDTLDSLYQAADYGRRIGMGSQLILSVDEKGKLSEFKVNLAKKGKPAVDCS